MSRVAEDPGKNAKFVFHPTYWGFRIREFPDFRMMARKIRLRNFHTFGSRDTLDHYANETLYYRRCAESYNLSKVNAEMQSLIKAVERMRLFQRSSWVEIPERPLLAWDAQSLQSGGAWALTKTQTDRQTAKRKVEVLVQTDENLSQTESEHLCAVLRAASHFVNVELTLQSTAIVSENQGGFLLMSRKSSDPWIVRVASSATRDSFCVNLLEYGAGTKSGARDLGVDTIDQPIVPGSYVWIPCNISLDTQEKRINLLKTIVTGQTKKYPGVDHLMIDPSEL